MKDFWNTPEGKVLMQGMHDHSKAIGVLGYFIFCVAEKPDKVNIDRANKALSDANAAMDYIYSEIKKLTDA